jgi:DNA-binding transcriptional regulator GbsR (MarR family)
MKNKNIPEVDYLADLVGEFIEYWGFKRIHGKIWLNLYLNQSPLDAAALMKKLSVSKALISISIKDLLEYNVIREEGIGPEGTRLYSANPDLHAVISHVLRQREKVLMGKIQAAFTQLKEMSPHELNHCSLEQARIKELDRFIRNGEKSLNTIMALL